MKITALIPDPLVKEVRDLAQGRTLTEDLILALSEWTAQQRIKQLNKNLFKKKFSFQKNFSAKGVRSLNRKKRT